MQIGYEFDFLREADAMKRIRKFVYAANKKPPVLIPREISGMTTRYDNQVFLILLKNSSFENEFMGDRVI